MSQIVKDIIGQVDKGVSTLWGDAGDLAEDIEEGVERFEDQHLTPLRKRWRGRAPGLPSPKRLRYGYPDSGMSTQQRRPPKRTKTLGDKKHASSERYTNSSKGTQLDAFIGRLSFNRVELPPRSPTTGGDSAAINRRDNHIFLKGIKFDVEWHLHDAAREKNLPNPHLGALYINWALIQFKCQVPESGQGQQDIVDAATARWFVDTTDNAKWYQPYAGYSTIPVKGDYSMLHHGGAMCPHNNYRILARRSFKKTPRLVTGDNGLLNTMHAGSTVVKFKQYMKTPQRIYLEGVGDSATWEHPIYEVYWISVENADCLSRYGTATTAAPVGTKIARNTVYYHEITNI